MAEETKKPSGSKEKNIGMAVVCYIWILVLIPLLTDAKNEPFVKYHVKQGIVLLIASIIGGVVAGVIPVLGWFIIAPVLSIFFLVLMIMGIINAVNGQEKPLPVIGQYADKINI